MKSINIYLNFSGNTEAAFKFYKSVFGGEFLMVQRFKDIPDSSNVPEEAKEMIMHISLPLGENHVLMGTDAPESMGFKVVKGNNFHINLNVESESEANELFLKLSEGGEIEMELENTFWGAYYGSLVDKFGIQWMINFQREHNNK